MPVSLPPPNHDNSEVLNYLMIWAIGFFSQLFRILMGSSTKEMGWVRVLSSAASAGIASLVAVNLADGLLGNSSSNFTIAISGIAGWLGGNAMNAMINGLEKRLGVPLFNGGEKPESTAPAGPPTITVPVVTAPAQSSVLPAPLDDVKGSDDSSPVTGGESP